jgi:hypothetical protein
MEDGIKTGIKAAADNFKTLRWILDGYINTYNPKELRSLTMIM